MLASSEFPTVVVGIATRNRADLLATAIRSVRSQTYPHLRLHLLDDASEDQTPELRHLFPDVRWDRVEKRIGLIKARNELMLNATEDIYASLDDDAWFLNGDEIELGVELMRGDPRIAAVAFDVLSPDRPSAVGRTGNHTVTSFPGCGHLLRLTAVRELNGYDDLPGFYGGEENDLCIRLLDAGYSVVRMDGVHVWHDKTLLGRDFHYLHRSGVCNDLASALRRFPDTIVVPTLIVKIIRHFIFAGRNKLLKPFIMGVFDFLGAWREISRKRHPVKFSTVVLLRRLRERGVPTTLSTWLSAAHRRGDG